MFISPHRLRGDSLHLIKTRYNCSLHVRPALHSTFAGASAKLLNSPTSRVAVCRVLSNVTGVNTAGSSDANKLGSERPRFESTFVLYKNTKMHTQKVNKRRVTRLRIVCDQATIPVNSERIIFILSCARKHACIQASHAHSACRAEDECKQEKKLAAPPARSINFFFSKSGKDTWYGTYGTMAL